MRFLVIGLGSIGQRHVRNLRTLLGPSAELCAYRVRGLKHAFTDQMQLDAASDVEKKYGIRAYPSMDEALATRPDAAFICNPNSLHMPTALAAARGGCHLFIEKPLSHSLDGVPELLETVEKKRLSAAVAYMMRFHPCYKEMKRLLDAGAVGPVVSARFENSENMADWHPWEDYRETYAAKKSGGGGVLLCQIHEFDMVYGLFGAPRRIWAAGGRLSRLETDVEDTASVLMEHEAGGRRFPVHVHLDMVRRPPRRTCEVIGQDGSLSVDFRAATLTQRDGAGRTVKDAAFPDFARNDMFLDELRAFLAAVEKKAAPAVTLADGLESLKMALRAKEALSAPQAAAA